MNIIYTIGYEGKTKEEIVSQLQLYNIKKVIDIRTYPMSKKKGYGKNSLRKYLHKFQIEYFSCENLGIPRYLDALFSSSIGSESWVKMEREYKSLVKDIQKDSYSWLKKMTSYTSKETGRIVLFGYHDNYQVCARGLLQGYLAEDIAKETGEVLGIVNL